VPVGELDSVRQLPASAEVPSPLELGAPEYRLQETPPDTLIWYLNDVITEEIDEAIEVARWQYDLVLDNRSSRAAHVTKVWFALSLDAAYLSPEFVEAGWTLSPGEVRRIPHAPIFRVSEFRENRVPEISNSLSIASQRR
jgi:hypothetical protein